MTGWCIGQGKTKAAFTYNQEVDKFKPRGRVWGGSSSLNAMAYVRGHAEDYNRFVNHTADISVEMLMVIEKLISDGGDNLRIKR